MYDTESVSRYQKLRGAGRAVQFGVTLGSPSVPALVCTCTYWCGMGDFQLAKLEETTCNEMCTNAAAWLN